MDKRCMSCLHPMGDYDVCPHCGWVEGSLPSEPYCLLPRTVLHERYTLGITLGIGGFGITYIAWDAHLNRRIAIKEFYPAGLVNRSPGTSRVAVYTGDREQQYQQHMRRFLAEARTMAHFSGISNIVDVTDYFEENNTAYIVMEYLDGITLKEFIKQSGGRLDLEVALSILSPICEALTTVHREGIVHRDVAPDNIMITTDNHIKLLDFGAARLSRGEEEKTLTIILKPGYAPPEQYRNKSRQGPFTDVYALGAMFYRMITGIVPEESIDRAMNDDLQTPTAMVPSLPPFLDNVVLRAMALNVDARFQTIKEFWEAIVGQKTVESPARRLRKRRVGRILVAVCVLGVMIGVGSYVYVSNTRLLPATLEVWLPTFGSDSRMDDALTQLFSKEEGSNESIVLPFCEENKNVEVNVTYIPIDEYEAKIEAAAADGTVPDLFLVNAYDPSINAYTVPLDRLINDLSVSASRDYYALGSYESYFPSKRCLPTGMQTSILFFNDKLNTQYGAGLSKERMSTDVFEAMLTKIDPGSTVSFSIGDRESLSMLALLDGSVTENGYDADALSMLERAYGWKSTQVLPVETIFPKSQSADDKNSETLFCYAASITDYMQAQKYLPGYCGVAPLPGEGQYPVQFTTLWCVGDNENANQAKAAQRLLAKLLGEQAQVILNVEAAATLPINRAATEEYYFSIYSQLGFLQQYLDDAAYVGEAQHMLTECNGRYDLVLEKPNE